jgi:hypothetical protein
MENLTNNQNPLKAFFRKPGIWIKLPSQGKFYKVKPTELNDMGEIPIYPMTAKDELMMKNADGLLNGSAIFELVRSCAPCISDPESMPSVDLDAILIAVRKCTYGDTLTVNTKHDCEGAKEHEVGVNLNFMIGDISVINDIEPVSFDNGVKVFIKPITVRSILQLNWVQYEQIRNLQVAEQRNVDEKTKVDMLQESYQKLTDESLKVVSGCVDTVLLPDGVTVADQSLIKEWITDLSRPDYKKLEAAVMSTNTKGVKKEFTVQCSECGKEYESSIDLNPTTFFE